MTSHRVSGVRLSGLVTAVPDSRREACAIGEPLDARTQASIRKVTGVETIRCAPDAVCTSDLCICAAERLLPLLGWSAESVGMLVFVSQTPDYILPATACVMQGRLGLRREVVAFDVNLGCSGYVYGLWIASSLLCANPSIDRALLLVGDTITKLASSGDRATAPLFGDAASATGLERSCTCPDTDYILGTDGTRFQTILVPAGGCRRPASVSALAPRRREDGSLRRDLDLEMNGAEVFNFTIDTVIPHVQEVQRLAAETGLDIDYYVLHQANAFMLGHLGKKLGIDPARMPMALRDFGNTSSSSIPLALTTALGHCLGQEEHVLCLTGFGVGLSWGSALVRVGKGFRCAHVDLVDDSGSEGGS